MHPTRRRPDSPEVQARAEESAGHNRRVVFQGRARSIQEWSGITGHPARRIASRLDHGWPAEAALLKPRGHFYKPVGRRPRVLSFDGREQTLTEWALEQGLTAKSLRYRIQHGWPVETALTAPPSYRPVRRAGKSFRLGKHKRTLAEWAQESGVNEGTIRTRLRQGLPLKEALKPPPGPQTLTHAGRTLTIAEWAREAGIPELRLRRRLRQGWAVADALKTPAKVKPAPQQAQTLTYQGRTRTVAQWARLRRLPLDTLRRRIHRGWSVEAALTTPRQPRPRHAPPAGRTT